MLRAELQPKQAHALQVALFKFLALNAISLSREQLPLLAPPILDRFWLQALTFREKYDILSKTICKWLVASGQIKHELEIKRVSPHTVDPALIAHLLQSLKKLYL
jgi:hypothetical protein